MAENLKTTRYNNGDLIGTTVPATMDISGQTEPKYQWSYNGDESNVATYGRLYTWYTVMDSRGVCPAGWHVPSDTEWTKLTDYLVNNGYGYEGTGNDIGKSLASTTGWDNDEIPGNVGNNQNINNTTNFNAKPAGVRNSAGVYYYLGFYASWWSCSESSSTKAWYRRLESYSSTFNKSESSKKYGATTRCIKN